MQIERDGEGRKGGGEKERAGGCLEKWRGAGGSSGEMAQRDGRERERMRRKKGKRERMERAMGRKRAQRGSEKDGKRERAGGGGGRGGGVKIAIYCGSNSKQWFTTSFLQPLQYLVTP